MPNWFTRLFRSKPAQPPQLSCFVQGVIRSIETERDQWRYQSMLSIEHTISRDDPKLTIELGETWDGDIVLAWVHDIDLSKRDRRALDATIRTHIINPRIKAEQDAENAKIAALRGHFEALGCPQERKTVPNTNE